MWGVTGGMEGGDRVCCGSVVVHGWFHLNRCLICGLCRCLVFCVWVGEVGEAARRESSCSTDGCEEVEVASELY